MALLSIAEPGKSTINRKHKLAVGIDLGTTNSLVATIKDDKLQILEDQYNRALCPSAVRYLNDGSEVVGYEALEAASEDPTNTIVSVKRLIGKNLSEVNTANLPYKFSASANNLPLIDTDRKSVV